ncbi:TetR family transcriptional regulator C-terminal domain-containing protein [Nocardia amamiensis]|uniref:TetR family transcriptional regulator C-terminal domain-containing protein n=1 Tax=Nocardia amamiensis TaxID=404578 RepID=A0ABS0CWT8_9NOCA|nr:TetR family transcriptional regulator C-terminal domain-containing protein [Nocardia amamiensis]MBF6301058.1 TetR family transcriptional regulator C-terminal domain-containing protein [Nocardia amamiensis]
MSDNFLLATRSEKSSADLSECYYGEHTMTGDAAAIPPAWRQSRRGSFRPLQDESPAQTMLFMEFWSAAMRHTELRREFAQRYAAIRGTIGSLVASVRGATGVEVGLPDDMIGPIVTALADGFALQRLADPESVPDSLFVEALRAVLRIRD